MPKNGWYFIYPLFYSGKQENHTFMYWELDRKGLFEKVIGKHTAIKRNWELYDLSSDIEEKIDLAHKKEKTLKDLIALAESSHQPARLGKILNQALVDKDRREAPHERNLLFKKPKK